MSRSEPGITDNGLADLVSYVSEISRVTLKPIHLYLDKLLLIANLVNCFEAH